jgi:hypothetical protein
MKARNRVLTTGYSKEDDRGQSHWDISSPFRGFRSLRYGVGGFAGSFDGKCDHAENRRN